MTFYGKNTRALTFENYTLLQALPERVSAHTRAGVRLCVHVCVCVSMCVRVRCAHACFVHIGAGVRGCARLASSSSSSLPPPPPPPPPHFIFCSKTELILFFAQKQSPACLVVPWHCRPADKASVGGGKFPVS